MSDNVTRITVRDEPISEWADWKRREVVQLERIKELEDANAQLNDRVRKAELREWATRQSYDLAMGQMRTARDQAVAMNDLYRRSNRSFALEVVRIGIAVEKARTACKRLREERDAARLEVDLQPHVERELISENVRLRQDKATLEETVERLREGNKVLLDDVARLMAVDMELTETLQHSDELRTIGLSLARMTDYLLDRIEYGG